MTKVTILGEANTEQKKLKPIEFTRALNTKKSWTSQCAEPSAYANIELVAKYTDFDIMLAYDNHRNASCLYLGHFNDGVVE